MTQEKLEALDNQSEIQSFDDVELSDEQVDKLIVDEDSELEKEPEQPNEAEESTNDENSDTKDSETSEQPEEESADDNGEIAAKGAEPETYEIDGQVLTMDDLKSGYLRHADYTRSKQELAEKVNTFEQNQQSLKGFSDFIGKIKDNQEVVSLIKDTLQEELGEDASKIFEDSLNMEVAENPEFADLKTKFAEQQREVDTINAQEEINIQMRTIAKNNNASQADVQEAYDYAVKRYAETDGKEVLTLETAFQLTNSKKQLSKSTDETKIPANKTTRKGNTGIRTKNNIKPKSFEDVDFDMDKLYSHD